jgi:hypothetical protein
MRRLLRPILVLLALFLLLEAWLWRHLEPIIARIVDAIPLDRLKARIAAWLEQLPPGPTLFVFIVPFILLLPLKFLEVWFIAHRDWLGAIVTLIAAKLLGLGVFAFIFEATRPKLLQMPWFRTFYEWAIWLLDRAHALIEPIKSRIRLWLRIFSSGRARRMVRLFLRLRRRTAGNAA